MEIKCYLAMTAAEFQNCPQPPDPMGWMACHFSPYGTGLSNLPEKLPEGSMLILNDRTPICGHDQKLILHQLTECIETFHCSCVLLDFERPGYPETEALTQTLLKALPCPAAVCAAYASRFTCPVFLPPVPVTCAPEEYMQPWDGREIWLEAAFSRACIAVTKDGAEDISAPNGELCGAIHEDKALHCHYSIAIRDNEVRFTLQRTEPDLRDLLNHAGSLGVTKAVGLWQELGAFSATPTNAKTAPEKPERS